MTLLVERPVDRSVFATCRVALDVSVRLQLIGDIGAQVIRIIGGVHDDMLGLGQPFDQALGLRAVAPLAGRDCDPDWQTESVDTGVDLGRQAAF